MFEYRRFCYHGWCERDSGVVPITLRGCEVGVLSLRCWRKSGVGLDAVSPNAPFFVLVAVLFDVCLT